MGNLSGESGEQNRKDNVTRFRSVTYARQLGLLVNTLGSHLKSDVFAAVGIVDGDETMVHAILSLLLNAFISVKREIFTT